VLFSAQVAAEGRAMSTEPQRTCPSCGNELSGAMEFGPVCMLRQGLAGGVESGESSASEDTIKPTAEQAAQRFEHYELVKGEDGKPVELGRGAMGVTYKAVDVDLHCPVTLKVISERYLGDESARLRFLREARSAASVRHPNVASVFHLGRTGQNYFYEALRQQMNFLTLLLHGLVIQIRGSERPGRRAKDWRNSSHWRRSPSAWTSGYASSRSGILWRTTSESTNGSLEGMQ
jgi:hypothetical protein